jgi:hypothetical protein
MKQIRLQTEPGRKNPLVTIWEKIFLNETSKFISSTHLKNEDLGKDFTDDEGETWKILGMMEGKDMPCQNSKGEIFIWDRWKVSNYMYPEKHEQAKKVVEYIPMKVKPKKTKKQEKEESLQLGLFNEEPEND